MPPTDSLPIGEGCIHVVILVRADVASSGLFEVVVLYVLPGNVLLDMVIVSVVWW